MKMYENVSVNWSVYLLIAMMAIVSGNARCQGNG